ncbi:MAG: TMEM165/GDT1 family protein [Candidatus Schekmanbacteria bacterium]|nr:MAG: TMEM165/GDT1 family protein [Candidatus Schekmanbacteria bacterium]
MDFKLLLTVFGTVFIAEIADKTQLATLLYASEAQNSKIVVFIGAAFALTVASAIAVFAGTILSNWIDEKVMSKIAGIAFVAIGIWTFFKG